MSVSNSSILLMLTLAGALSVLVVWQLHHDLIRQALESGDWNRKDDPGLSNIRIKVPTNTVVPMTNHSNQREQPKSDTTKSSVNVEIETSKSNATTGVRDHELPEALRLDPSLLPLSRLTPSTAAENCCAHWLHHAKHRRNRQTKRQKNRRNAEESKQRRTCTGICFTPHACDEDGRDGFKGDGVYPFKDQSEKERFALRLKPGKIGRDNCMQPSRQVPPIEWNTSSQFPFPELPPVGCSHYTGGGGSGAFQHLYIIPGAKLAFCGIPKVGITGWKQFFRFVMGAHDYLSLPYGKPDMNAWSFDRLEPRVQQEIWNDKEWTFAAILRDPAERLLSAYLDKLKINEGKRGGNIAKGMNLTKEFSFENFLEYLEKDSPEELNCRNENEGLPSLTGMNWCADPHWRPQVWGCGMSEKIDRFDFLGTLDHIADHTRALLEKVNLWESHGKFYRYAKSGRTSRFSSCITLYALQDEFDRTPPHLQHVGFQQQQPSLDQSLSEATGTKHASSKAFQRGAAGEDRKSWDVLGHARHASKKTDEYYNPELLRRVKDLYREDYQIWNLVNTPNGGWVSGKDILPDVLKSSSRQRRSRGMND